MRLADLANDNEQGLRTTRYNRSSCTHWKGEGVVAVATLIVNVDDDLGEAHDQLLPYVVEVIKITLITAFLISDRKCECDAR